MTELTDMWGMECCSRGRMITLRSRSASVRFRVVGELECETVNNFITCATPSKLRTLPETKNTLPEPPDSSGLIRSLFYHYYQRPVAKFVIGGRKSKRTQERLTDSQVGRFLRTFNGSLTTQRVATMVSSATGAIGSYLTFQDFVALCYAYLPVIPCLDYLTEYLEADSVGEGVISGAAAAQILERHGYFEAARWLHRRKDHASVLIAYPQLLYLMGMPSGSSWGQRFTTIHHGSSMMQSVHSVAPD